MAIHDPCREIPADLWERHLEEDLSGPPLTNPLKQACLQRLASTWSDLNWRYLRSRLKSPSIRLHEGQRRWGSWDPTRRLITIATRQVLCYTWESVVETLKHEVAHQFVSEALDADDEPPHGYVFREVCKLLAADPAPSGDGGVPLFRPGGAGRSADKADARLTRIRKLLALADNNPDEHEARAALARASELMLKYNLDTRDLDGQECVHRFLGKSSGRVAHHHYLIAAILQEFFFVQCIWVDSYDPRRGVKGHILEVMGRPANVDMAEYIHACLIRQCDTLWRAFKREQGIKSRTAKREYVDGLLAGFRGRLAKGERQSKERGLVWVGDPALGAYARRRHPRIAHSKIGGVGPSEIRSQGVTAGQQLRLRSPIQAQATARGRLLPWRGARTKTTEAH